MLKHHDRYWNENQQWIKSINTKNNDSWIQLHFKVSVPLIKKVYNDAIAIWIGNQAVSKANLSIYLIVLSEKKEISHGYLQTEN